MSDKPRSARPPKYIRSINASAQQIAKAIFRQPDKKSPTSKYNMRIVSAIISLMFLFPAPAYSEKLWGAILWDLGPTYENKGTKARPVLHRVKCLHFAGMAWDFPTLKKAIVAARKQCRNEWLKSELSHLIKDRNCGYPKQKDPIAGGTALGVYFSSGQCASYATGRMWSGLDDREHRCPVSGHGVGTTKAEADRKALKDCSLNHSRRNTCKVTMSACIK